MKLDYFQQYFLQLWSKITFLVVSIHFISELGTNLFNCSKCVFFYQTISGFSLVPAAGHSEG